MHSLGVFLVYYKTFLGVLKVVSNMIFHLTFINVWLIIIQKNKHCQWIKTEESHEYNFFDNIENLSIRSLWYHDKWHQEDPWITCVHFPPCERNPSLMLCSHSPINDSSSCLHVTVYLTVMLQASWYTVRVKRFINQVIMDWKTL